MITRLRDWWRRLRANTVSAAWIDQHRASSCKDGIVDQVCWKWPVVKEE